MLFYIPRWLWKHWEGGKIHALLMDMDIGLVADVEKKQKKKMLLDYLQVNLRHHNYWFYKYFFCELLALANTVGKLLCVRILWVQGERPTVAEIRPKKFKEDLGV